MKKCLLVIGVFALFLGMGGEVRGASSDWRFYLQGESWLKGDAFEKEKEFNQKVGEGLSFFFQEASHSEDISPSSVGLRAGLLKKINERGWSWGGSVGFIKGPTGDFVAQGVSPSLNHKESLHLETKFLRVMAELQKEFKHSNGWGFRVRPALGLAQGKMEASFVVKRDAIHTLFSADQSVTWTGLAWEVAPGFFYEGEDIRGELGLAYMQVPSLTRSESDIFQDFDWSPWGIQLTLQF